MRSLYYISVLCLLVTACLDPYRPPQITDNVDKLVVDASVNATDSSARVELSRSVSLSQAEIPPKETGAKISIETEDGTMIPLSEETEGVYAIAHYYFDPAKNYRLRIKRSNGREYQSTLEPFLTTPPIDSVTWDTEDNQLKIYVNTHDPSNASKYFMWSFSEAWEYTSNYASIIEVQNNQIISRPPAEDISLCYGSENSTAILIGTTEKLSNSRIEDAFIASIKKGERKLSRLFSIEVYQRSLTKEAFNYYLQLQKTTENLGSLFDPLPSQIYGNITCVTDPSEPVIGFFGGSSVSKKRIFIDFFKLPRSFQIWDFDKTCAIDTIPISKLPELNGALLITTYGTPPAGFLTSTYDCIDCRTFGGVTAKPSFWPR
jgi:hypothetical protein